MLETTIKGHKDETDSHHHALSWLMGIMAIYVLMLGCYYWLQIVDLITPQTIFQDLRPNDQMMVVFMAIFLLISAIGIWMEAMWGVISFTSVMIFYTIANAADPVGMPYFWIFSLISFGLLCYFLCLKVLSEISESNNI